MVSSENAAIVGAFALFVLVLAAGVAGGYGASLLFGVLLVPGIAILLPQVYLAATDRESDVPPRYRLRFGALVTILYAGGASTRASGLDQPILRVVAAALIVGLLAYEVIAGYRAATRSAS